MLTMARREQQKGIGFPTDLLKAVTVRAQWLEENGFQGRENFSKATLHIMRVAARIGWELYT